MRATSILAAVAALVLVAGCTREAGEKAESTNARQPAAERRDCELNGLVMSSARTESDRLFAVPSLGGEFFELNPRTLRPFSGRRVKLKAHVGFAEISPSGRLLALASGDSSEVQVVDLERMRLRAHLELEAAGTLEAIAWVGENRLLALAPEVESNRILVVDLARGRAIRAQTLQGRVQQAKATGGGLAVLLAPPERIGPSTFALVDREGRVCSIRLPEILSGTEGGPSETDAEETPVRQRTPGLALDRVGSRAFVIDAGLRIAAIDLARLRASYHSPSEPVSLWGRFGDWLEPEATAKLLQGPERQAVYLGRDMIAVSGVGYRVEGEEVESEPAGLRLIDAREWKVETVDTETSFLYKAGDTLFATVEATESKGGRLRAYDVDGDLRFELAASGPLWVSESAAGYVYISESEGRRYRRVDPASGRVRRVETETELWLIGDLALGS